MQPGPWSLRARVGYTLGSLAVGGCVVGMLVAAGPPSHTMAIVYPVLEPALEGLNVNNDWGFFSPNPNRGSLIRYRITDVTGEVHEFKLTEELDRWDPMFLRYTTLYVEFVDSPELYEPAVVRYLCRRHADLGAESVTLVRMRQPARTPDEFIGGRGMFEDLEAQGRPTKPCPGAAR